MYDVEIMILTQKHCFSSISIGRIGKMTSTKSFFFYSDILKFCPNRPIGYGDTNLEKKICYILFDAYLFKNCDKYQKKFIRKIILLFNFTSVYQILCNFIYWMKSRKHSIYSPFLPPPL